MGQGGFGITYLAEDGELGKRVAIKEFYPAEYCNRDNEGNVVNASHHNMELVERLKSRFIKEAVNLGKSDDHHGIVKINEWFADKGTAYFVMEYVEGENLLQVVRRVGPLDPYYAADLIRLTGNALNHIHSRRINHFDIKPSNIMMRNIDGTPVLIDFGLSKMFDGDAGTNSTVLQAVSHGFSPLELYNKGVISGFTPQTDVYSLAATLYFMMTGEIPPEPYAIMDGGLPFPDTIPWEFQHPIRKAMSPRMIDRYHTVREFCDALPRMADDAGDGYAEESSTPVWLWTLLCFLLFFIFLVFSLVMVKRCNSKPKSRPVPQNHKEQIDDHRPVEDEPVEKLNIYDTGRPSKRGRDIYDRIPRNGVNNHGVPERYSEPDYDYYSEPEPAYEQKE